MNQEQRRNNVDLTIQMDRYTNGTGSFRAFLDNRLGMIGFLFILGLILVAALSPLISPHHPNQQDLDYRLKAPSRTYPLGTDELGRCLLSRMLFGARVSLCISVIVVGVSALIGTAIGLTAGWSRGMMREALMRLTDIFMAFPGLILALVISGILGPGLFNVIFALTAVGWTKYARLVNGCVLSAKENTYVEAARGFGARPGHILYHHILPEIFTSLLVLITLDMGWAVLAAAALNFLGFGVQPPIPEWGSMLNSGRTFLRIAPHLSTFPGLAIMMTVLAFNFLGDGLRDIFDPRQNINRGHQP
jgi:peptide/nickel transport system permease protein